MARIAICDDSAIQLNQLKEDLSCISPSPVDCYADPGALLSAIGSGVDYDIVFLDIIMPGISGIDAAHRINKLRPTAQIIFITAFIDCARQISDADYIYFLVKPYTSEELSKAFQKANRALTKLLELPVVFPSGRDSLFIKPSEISYFERNERVTLIHCASQLLYTQLKLADIEKLLPESRFSRCHVSFLINLLQVSQLNGHSVLLTSGVQLPVSKRLMKPFKDALMSSLRELFD